MNRHVYRQNQWLFRFLFIYLFFDCMRGFLIFYSLPRWNGKPDTNEIDHFCLFFSFLFVDWLMMIFFSLFRVLQGFEPQPVDCCWQAHPPRSQLAAQFVSQFWVSLVFSPFFFVSLICLAQLTFVFVLLFLFFFLSVKIKITMRYSNARVSCAH